MLILRVEQTYYFIKLDVCLLNLNRVRVKIVILNYYFQLFSSIRQNNLSIITDLAYYMSYRDRLFTIFMVF